MLKTRIFTAVIILFLFLAALFYLRPIFWMVLLLALTVTGSSEWSKLAKFSITHAVIYPVLTVILGGELLFVLSEAVLADPYTHILSLVLRRLIGILDAGRTVSAEVKTSDQESASYWL